MTANNIITPQSVLTANATCTAAKTTYNDATNAVALLGVQSGGAVVYKITAVPRATVTATQLQLYRSRDGGTTLHLINLVTMAAYTMANTTSPTPTDFGYSETTPLRLGSTDSLYIGAAVALAGGITFDVQLEGI